MLNKILILSCLVASSALFAKTEVICTKATDNGSTIRVADEQVINDRIAQLEKEGKVVEIVHLSTSAGAGVATNNTYWGVASIDRVCAAIKY